MSDEPKFDKEFFYIVKNDHDLNKKINEIDDIWKYVFLNKVGLVELEVLGEKEAFMDLHSELAFSKKNGFSSFKKRRV